MSAAPGLLMGPIKSAVEIWPIAKLVFYVRNPRKNDAVVDRMCSSIGEFGFKIPVLARSDGEVIDGHLRLKAAKKLGIEEVPVILCDEWTPAQVKAFRLLVNQSASWASWDTELLSLEMLDLKTLEFDLALTGFDDGWLNRLSVPGAGLTDEDAIPELPVQPVSVTGDLWVLGEHRLLVGDATNTTDVARLMAGALADLVFTDPPYNVDYEGYTEDALKMTGDRMTPGQFIQFLEASFRSLRVAVKSVSSLYVCHPFWFQREFENALEAVGFDVRCQIIWSKNTFAWGFGRYKYQHELIFYAHVEGQKDPWYGDKSQSTVWVEKKPAANRIHPTAKPVELVERALMNSSKAGDVVVDLFAGSGSTLIGSERHGRKARLLEIDPKYADCIVRRYQEYTGKPVTLEATGQTFEQVKEQR